MAMIIVSGNEILRQKEGEKISDFCERTNIWDSSQPRSQPINQCDGCRRGLPIVRGLHRGPGQWDIQACTKDRYETSQPRHLPGMVPCPCGCGNLIMEGQGE